MKHFFAIFDFTSRSGQRSVAAGATPPHAQAIFMTAPLSSKVRNEGGRPSIAAPSFAPFPMYPARSHLNRGEASVPAPVSVAAAPASSPLRQSGRRQSTRYPVGSRACQSVGRAPVAAMESQSLARRQHSVVLRHLTNKISGYRSRRIGASEWPIYASRSAGKAQASVPARLSCRCLCHARSLRR